MLKTVSFYGVCLANAKLVLVSDIIGHPYRMRKIRAKFAAGAANEMLLRFFISEDDEAPGNAAPGGMSVLAEHGQVDYVRGEDEIVEMEHYVEMETANSWLKVYADNQDFNDHAVSVQITIDTVERA